MKITSRNQLNYILQTGYERRFKGWKSLYTYKRPSKWKNLIINPLTDESFTNGEDVYIGFLDAELNKDLSEILYMAEAKVAHEAGHVNFTNMELFNQFINQQPSKAAQWFCHNILNIVEDGRIENLMANEYKTLKNKFLYLRVTVFYDELTCPCNKDKITRILNNLLYYATMGMVQDAYRDHIDKELLNIIPLVDKYIYTRSATEAVDIFKSIWQEIDKLFYEYAKNNQQKSHKSSQSLSDTLQKIKEEILASSKGYSENPAIVHNHSTVDCGDYEGDIDKKDDTVGSNLQDNTGKEGKDEKEDTKGETIETSQGNSPDISGDSTESIGNSDESSKKTSADSIGNSDESSKKTSVDSTSATETDISSDLSSTETVLQDLKRDLERAQEEYNNSREEIIRKKQQQDYEKRVKSSYEQMKKELNRVCSRASNAVVPKEELIKISEFYSKHFSEEDYRTKIKLQSLDGRLKQQATLLHNKLETILVNKNMPDLLFQDRGQVDQSNLYQSLIGINDDIFIRRGQNIKSDYAISMLIDTSSSMINEKFNNAIKSAAIIEEAIAEMSDIALRIVSFGTKGPNIYNRLLRNFDDKINRNFSQGALPLLEGVMINGQGNLDYINLLYEAEMLKNRPESDKIMIILSDGLPNTRENIDGALANKKAVSHIHDLGIDVVPIFFTSFDVEEEFKKRLVDMYKTNVIYTQPNQINKHLINTLKTIVNR